MAKVWFSSSGRIAQRYSNTKFHWNSPSSYETCFANGRRLTKGELNSRNHTAIKFHHCISLQKISILRRLIYFLNSKASQWHWNHQLGSIQNVKTLQVNHWDKFKQTIAKSSQWMMLFFLVRAPLLNQGLLISSITFDCDRFSQSCYDAVDFTPGSLINWL
jgi:hypothetical protein